jgi:hypothetical protein
LPADEDPDGDENREGKYQKSVVDAWLKQAKTKFGIRSIICLLEQRQLRLYDGLQMDLVSYLARGFHVAHIPVRNYKHPVLSGQELERAWKAYNVWRSPY